jgi:ribonuclease Y
MNIWLAVVIFVVMTGLGFLVGFFYRKRLMESHIESLEGLGKKILDEARKEAENIKKEARLQAKDQLYQLKQDFEKETQERRQELLALERRFLQKKKTWKRKQAC